MIPTPPSYTLFPYTTLFRSVRMNRIRNSDDSFVRDWVTELGIQGIPTQPLTFGAPAVTISGHPQAGFSTNNAFFQWIRSEEHTSEPQSQSNLVCRLLLEKKK